MPLKLVAPRPGRTPYWYVRGSYLGIAVERSTKSTEERVAKAARRRWKDQIERGEYRDAADPVALLAAPATFLAAAVAYMQAGGERKFISRIIELTGPYGLRDRPLAEIDQLAIDQAANALFPTATPQTKNRHFYTPISAILKRAGIERGIRRPKGWRGKKSTSWLEPAQAFALFQAADGVGLEFGLFLRTLLYTGMRLSEALGVTLGRLDLERAAIYLPETKNGEPRTVFLPPVLVTALANHPRGLKRNAEERLFRYHKGGRLCAMLKRALADAEIFLPPRQAGFHVFCHTYGTWMGRYGELDTYGLTRTERWKDPRSADRYRHTEHSEESRRASWLPVERKSRKDG